MGVKKTDFAEDATRAIQMIRQTIEIGQSRQKSYADARIRPLKFKVGDQVFIQVAPMKGIMRFGKKGKLRPQYIWPYEIIKQSGQSSLTASITQIYVNDS